MRAAQREHDSGGASNTAYWACQLAGWGGYGLCYYLAVLVPFHATGPKQMLGDAAYCATAVLGTHLLRLWMKQRGWSELGYARLAPRLMLGALLVGTLQTAALFGCLTLEGGMDWGQAPVLPIMGVTVFFSAFLVALWLAVYLAVLAVRRRRAAEMNALRAELAGREAKLRSLQQQLNPHFLFNCLNSLRGMIDEDRGRAQQTVTRLAELLRASLRQDETSAIPLEEELATVDAYLELESVRLEERLRIRREIAPEASGAHGAADAGAGIGGECVEAWHRAVAARRRAAAARGARGRGAALGGGQYRTAANAAGKWNRAQECARTPAAAVWGTGQRRFE